MKSRSRKNLLTLTKEEKKEIKKKKLEARIEKLSKRKEFLENETGKLRERQHKLLAELLSDEEEKMNSDSDVN